VDAQKLLRETRRAFHVRRRRRDVEEMDNSTTTWSAKLIGKEARR
jgi:hypothetical protein